jgi:hypothetical protein
MDKTTCVEVFAWGGACADVGIFAPLHEVMVPYLTKGDGPMARKQEGGYLWSCEDCYISADKTMDPECIRAKGYEECFDDVMDDILDAEQEVSGPGSGSSVGVGVIAGSVVGGACNLGFRVEMQKPGV